MLNVLSDRVTGRVEGTILYNGHPKEEAKSLLRQQAYVMQDDILPKTSTPAEVMEFNAKLRLPNVFSDKEKCKIAEAILRELNIYNVKDTQIGAPGEQRGISGGERKRLAIGTGNACILI